MIVVGGESLVDLLVGEDGQVVARPGGGPFNVARGLARLGAETAFCGALSRDRFGRGARAALAAEGVRLDWAVERDLPTTLALAELGPGGAAYRFYADGTAAPSLDVEDVATVPVPRALLVGALGLVLEPMAGALEALVARCAGEALVMVDVNWRPAAIADPAAQRARLARVLAHADVVKVSTEDLDHMGEDDPRSLAPRVLVTDGGRPAVAYTPEGELRAEVPEVDVVDTVGAGDAFCAGWLTAWSAGRDDRRALELAVRAGAVACTRAGADPPRRGEMVAY